MTDLNPVEVDALAARLDRIEKAIRTMAWWLVEAQTGFGTTDAVAINAILDAPSLSPAGLPKSD